MCLEIILGSSEANGRKMIVLKMAFSLIYAEHIFVLFRPKIVCEFINKIGMN